VWQSDVYERSGFVLGVSSLVGEIVTQGALTLVGLVCSAILTLPTVLRLAVVVLDKATDLVRAVRGLPPRPARSPSPRG
jgi:hypothetical protein